MCTNHLLICRHYQTVEDMKQELATISAVRRPLASFPGSCGLHKILRNKARRPVSAVSHVSPLCLLSSATGRSWSLEYKQPLSW